MSSHSVWLLSRLCGNYIVVLIVCIFGCAFCLLYQQEFDLWNTLSKTECLNLQLVWNLVPNQDGRRDSK